MKLKNKILFYFSSVIITLFLATLLAIFTLFNSYREEEFQQIQKEKVLITIKLLADYREIGANLTSIMDKLTIHDFYDEKMLIFDENKNLIYSSIDDLEINKTKELLNHLSSENIWLETKEGKYDVIGIYSTGENGTFYALSKAYDKFGYSKLSFLRNLLMAIFLIMVVAVIGIALWMAKIISKPIVELAHYMEKYTLNSASNNINLNTSTLEIQYLGAVFKKMMSRVEEAFSYQKHITSHISHELKTPIAILVSELEKIEKERDLISIQSKLKIQKEKTKSLGDIINALLRLSKLETGQDIYEEKLRIDEILFDIIEEISTINTQFNFEIQYINSDIDEENLYIKGNKMLLRLAFYNLLNNCLTYSDEDCAIIEIDSHKDHLKISITNSGLTIQEDEQKYLFEYYFRGKNSEGKPGFGLGLVLCKKILTISGGNIRYSCPSPHSNQFNVSFNRSLQ